MKKLIYIILAVVLIGLLVWPKLKSPDSAPGQQAKKGGPVLVSTVTVSPVTTEHLLEATGNVMAAEEVVLYPETQGRIESIQFTEGAQVQKGQLLVKLNDLDLKAQLRKATSSLRLRQLNDERNQKLFEKGAISQEANDQSVSELNAANADVDLLKEQIRKTEIRAPFAGRIGLRKVSEGSFVNSATAIAALQDLETVKIEFAVAEKYAAQIHVGSVIHFNVDGIETAYDAKVYAIEPKVDEVTRNVVMRAACKNPGARLMPGAFARIRLVLDSKKQTFRVPTQAIVPILKGQKVYVLSGDSVLERKVSTGTRGDTDIEITEGLQTGDQVVVEGTLYLKPGAKVKTGARP